MVAFAFKTGNTLRLSYDTKHSFQEAYVGCGVSMDDLWNVCRIYLTREQFMTAYHDLLRQKMDNWKSNPFSRAKKQAFIEQYRKGGVSV